ncbi:EKC/KEOPS complex subunit TPRKB isoform X5 [Helianthus annuus]|uniref:EKC/KEOPS complex subunit TPRKB isoform X5 n=1 Tax=Helianthus annuus TaxID=4232 RepID=UPI0016533001|nr:EKC/KEOPS complex subunit TPRKB isoform X5 [Helianthus annuus]
MKVYELSGTTLSVALFTDVANSKYYFCTLFFRLNLCVIETLILARELLELMQAGTLEPEVALLNASLISESLKRCGISDSTTYILVARFGALEEEMTAMKTLIKGKEIDLEELEGKANKPQIQKHYKITGVELGISTLGDAITCRIAAARDAL